jgi:hypothetical protein
MDTQTFHMQILHPVLFLMFIYDRYKSCKRLFFVKAVSKDIELYTGINYLLLYYTHTHTHTHTHTCACTHTCAFTHTHASCADIINEALHLWPQCCNSAKTHTVLQQFPTRTVLTVTNHATVVVTVPSTVHYPANYKIKIYYFR